MHYLSLHEKDEHYKIAYQDVGNGPKIMLCVHGVINNLHDFDFITEYFSHEYRIIALDMPGRGHSSYLQNIELYNYDFYHKCIVDFISALNITKIDCYIGNSMGAIIGMQLASEYNALISNFVINDVGTVISKTSLSYITEHLKQFHSFSTHTEIVKHIKTVFQGFNITEEKHWEHLLEHNIAFNPLKEKYFLQYDKNIFAGQNTLYASKENIELWDIWNSISSNILILRGKMSKFLKSETLQQMVHSKHNVSYYEYKNTGHHPSLREKQHFIDIERWLNAN